MIAVFIIPSFSFECFIVYSYISDDDLGSGTIHSKTNQSLGWIITNRVIDFIGLMVLIWGLWKVKFIDRALKKLKNSDEFGGEYFEESVSDCGPKEIVKPKEKENQEEKEKEKIMDLIEEKLKKYKDFSCLKKRKVNNTKIENKVEVENKAEVYSDSEIEYKNMCQFMHPIDFLGYKKKTNDRSHSSPLKSQNHLDNFAATQFDKIPKKRVHTIPKANLEQAVEKIVKGLNPDKCADDLVMHEKKKRKRIKSNKLSIKKEKIVKGLNPDKCADDLVMHEKKKRKRSKSNKYSEKKNKHSERKKNRKETGITDDLNFKKMDITGPVIRK